MKGGRVTIGRAPARLPRRAHRVPEKKSKREPTAGEGLEHRLLIFAPTGKDAVR